MKRFIALGFIVAMVAQANASTVEHGAVMSESKSSSRTLLHTASSSYTAKGDSSYVIHRVRPFKQRLKYILSPKHYPQYQEMVRMHEAVNQKSYRKRTDWSLRSLPELFQYDIKTMDQAFVIENPWTFSWNEIYRSHVFKPGVDSLEMAHRTLLQFS